MTNWPNWKPNSVLKAAELAALEDYLLTPWRFTSDFCAGVDSMRPQSVVAQASDNTLTLSVRSVRGITQAGCPVVLGDGSPARAQIGLKGDGITFDAIVHVNDGVSPTKLALELKAPDATRQGGEQLWLGRFSWDSQAGLRPTLRPPVRRLAALRDYPDWGQWVAPVAEALKSLSTRIPPPPQMEDSRLLASATEIHRLRFEWPTLTIVAVMRAARFLSWVCKDNDEAPSPVQSEDASREQEHGSDMLPQRLASYLVESAPSTTLEDRLTPDRDYLATPGRNGITVTLLRALSAGVLELRFPLATLGASEQITITGRDVMKTILGRAIGPVLRFALPPNKIGFPSGYRFDALSSRLAAQAPVELELWHLKSN